MKSDPRQTILVITLGMIVVYLAFQVKWAITAALMVGVAGLFSDKLAEKIGLFTRVQFRYFFYPAVEGEIITEVIYTAGGHTGLRFYF